MPIVLNVSHPFIGINYRQDLLAVEFLENVDEDIFFNINWDLKFIGKSDTIRQESLENLRNEVQELVNYYVKSEQLVLHRDKWFHVDEILDETKNRLLYDTEMVFKDNQMGNKV